MLKLTSFRRSLSAVLVFTWTGIAANRAAPAEAKAMLDKAVAHYKAVGRKQALADFSAKKAPFVDRDLYVVCIGYNGVITAHGFLPVYVGSKAADTLKDAEGKPVGTDIWKIGSSKGAGSIVYPMLSPVSGKVEQKTAFFQKVGEDVCAVGAYGAP
jgi:cytochrome c